MSRMPIHKYLAFPPIDLPDRQWPSRVIQKAPLWCSVDLRDGNQALIEPMGLERKGRMFAALVKMGFKEIEVGFPSSSQPDFDFVRELIEHERIPDDVTIQVLTQAREPLIRRTFESLRGVKRAIVHVYNSTSALQRRVVFGIDRKGARQIAVSATELIVQLAREMPNAEIGLEYSPESFTGTELDFAKEICEAVMNVWRPTPEKKIILNLPATVELSTPNVYADQVEWFGRNIRDRDAVVLSLHPHNDRGTATAAAELGMMAGADRVEGTLFGNGERTGNVDLVTLALNMVTQGIDPNLEIHDIDALVKTAEYCNRLPVHPRHPYAGDLVFTAFSGSHQDAIRKGLAALKQSETGRWEVPYLPMDPGDLGRTYDAVIRVNSQSGKGGVAYVLESERNLRVPRKLLIAFSKIIQRAAEETDGEVAPAEIVTAFEREYVHMKGPLTLVSYENTPGKRTDTWSIKAMLDCEGEARYVEGTGNGPIDAFTRAVSSAFGVEITVTDYEQHALAVGADSSAVAYVGVAAPGGRLQFGVGMHANTITASLHAVVVALNRLGVRSATLDKRIVEIENSSATPFHGALVESGECNPD
jgi:2-isopropylmalate synthase